MTREMHVTYHFSVSLRKGQAVCRHLCGFVLFVEEPQWSTCISVPHPPASRWNSLELGVT